MTHSKPGRRVRALFVTLISVTALVGVAVAGPAVAHDDTSTKRSSKSSEKSKAKSKKSKDHSGHAGPAVITAALTGDSPCEVSGPPASEGQIAKDAEGHDARGPLTQKPLTRAEREELIAEQAQAREVAVKYPNVAAAEAAGYKKSTVYVPCIGAHYTNQSLVPKFDPAAPSELLFDGDTPDAKIVGLSYLVFNAGGAPDGFAGPNDVWHQHNANGGLCLNSEAVVVGNETTTKADCAKRGGRKVKLDDIWMVHNWVVPGWECGWGVFAGECPELGGRLGGTVFDEPDPSLFEQAGSPSASEKKKAKAKAKAKAKHAEHAEHEDEDSSN